MANIGIKVEQVISLVNQLPMQDRYTIWQLLNADREAWWNTTLDRGEQRMRQLSAERGLDWDSLSEDDRESLVDDLLHEA